MAQLTPIEDRRRYFRELVQRVGYRVTAQYIYAEDLNQFAYVRHYPGNVMAVGCPIIGLKEPNTNTIPERARAEPSCDFCENWMLHTEDKFCKHLEKNPEHFRKTLRDLSEERRRNGTKNRAYLAECLFERARFEPVSCDFCKKWEQYTSEEFLAHMEENPEHFRKATCHNLRRRDDRSDRTNIAERQFKNGEPQHQHSARMPSNDVHNPVAEPNAGSSAQPCPTVDPLAMDLSSSDDDVSSSSSNDDIPFSDEINNSSSDDDDFFSQNPISDKNLLPRISDKYERTSTFPCLSEPCKTNRRVFSFPVGIVRHYQQNHPERLEEIMKRIPIILIRWAAQRERRKRQKDEDAKPLLTPCRCKIIENPEIYVRLLTRLAKVPANVAAIIFPKGHQIRTIRKLRRKVLREPHSDFDMPYITMFNYTAKIGYGDDETFRCKLIDWLLFCCGFSSQSGPMQL